MIPPITCHLYLFTIYLSCKKPCIIIEEAYTPMKANHPRYIETITRKHDHPIKDHLKSPPNRSTTYNHLATSLYRLRTAESQITESIS